jgi:hypothetical protein
MKRRELLARPFIAALALGVLAASSAPGATSASPSVATPAQVVKLVAAASALQKLPQDLRPPLADAPNDNSYNFLQKGGCTPAPADVKMGSCIFGDTSATHTMVLFGDSHAEMWFSGFNALAMRRHWRLAYLGKSGCSAPYLHYFDGTRRRAFTECDKWHAYAVDRVRKMHPAVIVVTSEYFTPEDAQRRQIDPATWTAGLVKTLRLLAAPHVKEVVLGDIPYLAQSAPECLAAHENDIGHCSTPASSAILTDHAAAEKKAAAETGASYISTVPWFCSSQCAPVIGNMVVYFDAFHISQTYATYLSGALEAALTPAMGGK